MEMEYRVRNAIKNSFSNRKKYILKCIMLTDTSVGYTMKY